MASRIHDFFLAAFLLLAPWQTIWLFRVPVINGSVWQYGIIGVYATEVVLLCAALFFFMSQGRSLFSTLSKKVVLGILLALCAVAINIIVSHDRLLASVGWFRLFEMVLLVLMLIRNACRERLLNFFLIGLLPAAFLGIAQCVFNTAWAVTLLGTSLHNPQVPGTIVVMFRGVRHLRAYGPFPHPNIFGAYMAVGFLFAVSKSITSKRAWWYGCSFLFCNALLASFSRTAFLTALLGSAVIAIRNKKCLHFFLLAALTLSLFFPLYKDRIFVNSALELRSLQEHADSLKTGLAMLKKNWWWGQGVDNYTVFLRESVPSSRGYTLQPVHDVPLLISNEIGVIGLILFAVLFFLFVYPMHGRTFLLMSTLGILTPILLFDHFLWSLYPGLVISSVWFCFAPLCIFKTLEK